jgi:hypothetical protein
VNSHQPREITFHLTLTEEDRELLDTLAHRMGVSRTETISRALHLLEAVQERQGHENAQQGEEPSR